MFYLLLEQWKAGDAFIDGLASGFSLWETSGMAKDYTPKVGDIVTAQGQNATFKVIEVTELEGIKIQPFHIAKQETFGQVMPNIPRAVLKPFTPIPR
jgi:hypothetical protein